VVGCGFLIFDGGVTVDYYFFFKVFVASFVMTFIFVISESNSVLGTKQWLLYSALGNIFSGISVVSLIIAVWMWVFD